MEIAAAPHPFAELIGLEFDHKRAGESLCRLRVSEALMNPQGVVHGAVLYALADTGMGGALYPTLEAGQLCATIEIKISYFRPVRGGEVRCHSRISHRGSRVASLESEIQAGEVLVAKASGSFSIFTPRA
ncbi:MAG: PaaI family thioesterase [Myxococcales bacterium]|nr:PaaI family thioesterase [Myxococcales bacterium]